MLRVTEMLVGLIVGLNLSPGAHAASSLEPLTQRWSYSYYYHSPDTWRDQEFAGIADLDGNVYWLLCTWSLTHGWPQMHECRLRSADFDGNFRYEVQIGSGLFGEFTTFQLYLVAGPVVVAEHSGLLIGFDTATGLPLWNRDLRAETHFTNGMAYDGEGRIIVTTGASVQALSAYDGSTIWRQYLGSEDPNRRVYLHTVLLDESRNLYFARDVYLPYPLDLDESWVVSLGPEGSPRFETRLDLAVQPVAVAHGRLLVGQRSQYGAADLLDTQTGAGIARLGTMADASPWYSPIGLISRELGFFMQRVSGDDVALAAFDLASGEIRWRFRLAEYYRGAPVLSGEGNVLIANKGALLEISPEGRLLRSFLLRANPSFAGESLLLRGRWFSHLSEPGIWPQENEAVVAYDLPGAPDEGRLGWNSRHANPQGENRPREE